MANIAKALREEVSRLARRELKSALASLKKDAVALKKTNADLKRRLTELERQNRRLLSNQVRNLEQPTNVSHEDAERSKISGKGILALRKRLGMSQAKFAKLIDVTPVSVYLWERQGGPLNLRQRTKLAVLSARKMSVREAKEQLAKVIDAEAASKPPSE